MKILGYQSLIAGNATTGTISIAPINVLYVIISLSFLQGVNLENEH